MNTRDSGLVIRTPGEYENSMRLVAELLKGKANAEENTKLAALEGVTELCAPPTRSPAKHKGKPRHESKSS